MRRELFDEKLKEGEQKMGFYKKIITSDKLGTLQILEQGHSKIEIRYLGRIRDLSTRNAYHVISNFRIIGIGEMLSPRGRSEIAFIDLQNEYIIIYDFGMPENLPNSIRENVLYFSLKNTEVGISISGGLPTFLCLPEIGCH